MQKKVLETPCMFVLCSCSSLQKRTREAPESNNAVLAAMNQHKRKRGKKNIDLVLVEQLMVTEKMRARVLKFCLSTKTD